MRVREFARHSVSVTEPVIVNAYMKEKEYLCSLDMDKLLAGFRETAGLPECAERYSGGWENTELSGHTLGHYMVALAQIYAAEQSEDIKERLEYILSELGRCQAADGYLFTSGQEIFEKLEQGGLAYMPWYTMHKILTGLLAVYRLTGMEDALSIGKKLGDWIAERVLKWTDKERKKVLCIADGGMNDCLYELYKITGKEDYVEAAEQFDEPDLYEKIAAGKDILQNKHAGNTIPKILGALNRYMALGASQVRYLETAKAFFDMVTKEHTYITGGNGELEHFRAPGELAADRTQYNCEACSAYNMIKLAERLYAVTGEKRYMDYYEQTLMNAVLGSQNPENGMVAFFQPMATGYFKTFATPFDKFWCCTGTGMESFTNLGSGIYHTTGDGIYVNLYVSSVLEEDGAGLKLTQTVDFDKYDSAEFLLEMEDTKNYTLYFRMPEWCGEDVKVTVNGETVKYSVKNGYLCPEGRCKDGDRIVLDFYPEIKLHTLPDMENCAAVTYGPFVLAAGLGREDMTTERIRRTNVTVSTKNVAVRERVVLQEGLKLSEWFADCKANFVKADGEFAFSIKGTDADEHLVFIPYYKKYDERYGIYFDYYDDENLPEDLRALIEEQKRLEEERLAEEAEAARLAEEERLRLEEEERLRQEEEQKRLEEAERRRQAEEEERARQQAEEAERQRQEEEERIRLAAEAEAEHRRQEAEEEERRRKEAEEAERQRLESAAEEQRNIEAEARRIAAQNVADAERAAELAEAKLREEEANLQAAKLAAERAEAEAAAQKAEAEAARLRREAEEEERIRLEMEAEDRRKKEEEERRLAEEEAERQRLIEEAEEQKRIETEARQIAAQKVADAERAAELAEAEARQAAAQTVADAERAADLAEAKRREEEENLQAAKLAAERTEAEAATLKAEAEVETAKAMKAEGILKQEKVHQESEKVHKAADKAADKEKKKALKKRRKKQRRAYRDFSVLKTVLWVVGALALIVVLYFFATPISKGFFIGKNAVDTFFEEKLPTVAKTLKIKGNGHGMPVFKGKTVYLKEDAENYVKTAVLPQGYSASVVRLNGKQYICVEGNGLKTYYLNEIAENESKHIYLEKGDKKAMYFKEYSFENPASLCPISGTFNTIGTAQYVFISADGTEIQILDAGTLKECRVTVQTETLMEVLNVSDYAEAEQNVRISMTVEDVPYTFDVMKKSGLTVPDDYRLTLDSVRYVTKEQGIGFKACVMSAGMYLGEVAGTLDYVAGGYVPAEVIFYGYADEEYVNGGESPVLTATHYQGTENDRYEVIGDKGEHLLIPIADDIPRNDYDETMPSVKGIDVSEEQGKIDWEKVADSGVEYAMIRVGERGSKTSGKCELDSYFKKNAKGAADAGIGVGVTFVSRATTVKEAQEEAQYVLKQIKDYTITWPVALDTTEAVGAGTTRASGLSAEDRTACAEAFLKEIEAGGYTAVLYTDARWGAFKLDLEELSDYDMWYNSEGTTMTYPYRYTMQKYDSDGEVLGITKGTGMNYGFVNYGE